MTHKQGENKAPGQQNRGVHEGLRIQEEHHLPANATHKRQVKQTRGGNPGSGTGEVSQPNATRQLRDSVTVSPHPWPWEQPGMSRVCSPLAPPAVRTVQSRTHLTEQFCGRFLLSHLHSLSTSPQVLLQTRQPVPAMGLTEHGHLGSHTWTCTDLQHPPRCPNRPKMYPNLHPPPVTLVPQQILTVTSHGR